MLTAMVFDRLLYIDRLKEAGIDEAVARAHSEALREALLETVATKADLKDGFVTVDGKFEAVYRQFDLVERRFDDVARKFDALDHKIELTARDLTIKGASGLIVIATLIVGLTGCGKSAGFPW